MFLIKKKKKQFTLVDNSLVCMYKFITVIFALLFKNMFAQLI